MEILGRTPDVLDTLLCELEYEWLNRMKEVEDLYCIYKEAHYFCNEPIEDKNGRIRLRNI